MKREREAARAAPWWLGEEAPCERCLVGYALLSECRCAACDGALCWLCVVELRGGRWCPDCAPREEHD